MGSYLTRRLGASLLLLFLTLSFTFFLIRLAPGGPLAMYTNSRLTSEQMDRLRASYGLDQPLHRQYFSWLEAVTLRGDWGHSFSRQRPAAKVIAEALPATFLLGLVALMVQVIGGLILGTFSAQRPEGWRDHLIRLGTFAAYSVPTFWLGVMAILLFHLRWGLLPAGGFGSVDASSLPFTERLLDTARHLVLPAMTLGIVYAAQLTRFVRNSLVDILGQEFVRTARAKGLSEWRVLWVHGLRNTMPPVLQLVGLSIPMMLNGVLVTEVVFSWPGLGRLMFEACVARDYPLILAGTAVSAALVIIGSLVADLLLHATDPRTRDALV